MKVASVGILLLGLLLLDQLEGIHGCSCVPTAFSRSRNTVLREDYCSSPEVYTATVISATCNCLIPTESQNCPGPQDSRSLTSNMVNCQRYELQNNQNSIDASIISQGQCDQPGYTSSVSPCSCLGNYLANPGQSAGNPNLEPGVVVQNTTTDVSVNRGCRYICPFNALSENEDVIPNGIQPCMYRVRVGEVFKGNISRGDEMDVSGPDVLTSCGRQGFLLQISTEYLVGIGGACSPISSWNNASSYSSQELDFLRLLSNVGECAGALSLLPSLVFSILGLLLAMLFN